MTFAQVAKTERAAGNEARAQHNIGLAEEAYGEAQRRIGDCERLQSPESFDAAEMKSIALRTLIRAFNAVA